MPDRAPRVAICMATYQPERERLLVQLDTIRRQTVEGWHCWVADDASSPVARDTLRAALDGDPRVEHEENVGFYRNFERALDGLPPDVEWVALADQDDEWHPHKLARLLDVAQRDPQVRLVYSDVEIKDGWGVLVSPTYWVGRVHNEDDLAALIFANTVTGAASLVRADVVRAALPFPTGYPTSFHDHWLALVARCSGRIVYVDEPLHVYVQHEHNAIGHQPAREETGAKLVARHLHRRWWRRPQPRYNDDEVARLSDLASTLIGRMEQLRPADSVILRAVQSLHGARPALGWLLGQAVREIRDPSVTMWRRRRVLASVVWTQVETGQERLSRSIGKT